MSEKLSGMNNGRILIQRSSKNRLSYRVHNSVIGSWQFSFSLMIEKVFYSRDSIEKKFLNLFITSWNKKYNTVKNLGYCFSVVPHMYFAMFYLSTVNIRICQIKHLCICWIPCKYSISLPNKDMLINLKKLMLRKGFYYKYCGMLLAIWGRF